MLVLVPVPVQVRFCSECNGTWMFTVFHPIVITASFVVDADMHIVHAFQAAAHFIGWE